MSLCVQVVVVQAQVVRGDAGEGEKWTVQELMTVVKVIGDNEGGMGIANVHGRVLMLQVVGDHVVGEVGVVTGHGRVLMLLVNGHSVGWMVTVTCHRRVVDNGLG